MEVKYPYVTDINQTRFWRSEMNFTGLGFKSEEVNGYFTLVEIDFYPGDLIGCCCLSLRQGEETATFYVTCTSLYRWEICRTFSASFVF